MISESSLNLLSVNIVAKKAAKGAAKGIKDRPKFDTISNTVSTSTPLLTMRPIMRNI